MQNSIIKVKATLVQAKPEDIFTEQGLLRENKKLFAKYPFKEEYFLYTIPGTDKYWLQEVLDMATLCGLYVLTPEHNEKDFCFYLVLRRADDFDFFDGPRFLKRDVVYYEIVSEGILGPLITGNFTNVEKLKAAMAIGRLYVPGKQLFERFKRQQSA